MNSIDREIININKNNNSFFEINQQTFNELLTFVNFVDRKLNIGFVEINFAKDRDILIEALVNHQNRQDIKFEILDFSDPNLRFLRDELVTALNRIKIEPNKKLILLITGLEKSIGVTEKYPDVLVNLNFVRVYNSLRQYSQAIDYYQQLLQILQEIGDRNGEASAWFNLGYIWKNLQQKPKAKTALENAKRLYQEMGLDGYVEKCDRAIKSLEE